VLKTPYASRFTLHTSLLTLHASRLTLYAHEPNKPWGGEEQEKFKNQDLTPTRYFLLVGLKKYWGFLHEFLLEKGLRQFIFL